jgi:glycosyltransferase involved in cell wall biosynthesis
MAMERKKSLNVVMVAACPFPANHGSAASIREMSEALVRLGHHVHVVTYPIQEDIAVEGVTVHRVNCRLLKPGAVKVGPSLDKFVYDPLMILKLLQVVIKHKIDVIHAHNYEGALIGWFAKVLTRRPMLYNAVTNMVDELPSYNFFKPRFVAVWLGKLLDWIVPRMGNYITVVSDELKDFLIGTGIAADRIRVVPAGVNLDMFAHGNVEKIRARHELGDSPVVMYTGAFEEFQRVDYLIQAMAEVVKEHPAARLLLVGNVKNRGHLAKYEDLARGLGIGDRVTFANHVPLPELTDYLATADVTVVPRPECPGHPVKLLNYMAAGKATVSFRGGAKGLHHMHNGYLAQDHDVASLARGISLLLARPDLRKTLGAQAYRTIAGNFDWMTLARGIEIIYRGMLGGDMRVLEVALGRYIKESYVFRYMDRRSKRKETPQSTRRVRERRKRVHPIDFIERRRVGFEGGASQRAQAEEGLQQAGAHPDEVLAT